MFPTGANITTMRQSRFSATRGTCSHRLTLFVFAMNMVMPPLDSESSQKNPRADGTGQRDDPQPRSALPKRWTVDEQNRAASERHYCYQRQQNPQHPFGKPSVSSGSHVMIARCGHTGYDRGENRVERLV